MKVKDGKRCIGEWERRVIAYHEQLEYFFDALPAAMRVLIEDVPTKDAEVVHCAVVKVSFELTLRVASGLSFGLTYALTAPPSFQHVGGQWPRLWNAKVHWLYDEVGELHSGMFTHSILLSSGILITVPFRDFQIKRLDYEPEVPNKGGISPLSV